MLKFALNYNRDLVGFIKSAQKNDLWVILRPGPYIDAERDLGGLPFWLLQKDPRVRLRTSDPSFIEPAEKWLTVLYTKLAPLAIGNGGPIIMVQIENEYGSYAAQTSHSDTKYLVRLRDLAAKHFGNSVLLFSTDSGKLM